MIGSVDEYGTVAYKGKTYPVVGISARVIECSTGKIVLSADMGCKAKDASLSLAEHARSVVREMMAAISRDVKRARLELHGLSEQLLNARLVRGFGMEQTEHDDFLKRIDRMAAAPKNATPTEREAWWLERFTPMVCTVMVLFLGWLLGLKLIIRGGTTTVAAALVWENT